MATVTKQRRTQRTRVMHRAAIRRDVNDAINELSHFI
jgi:hypothetical protein